MTCNHEKEIDHLKNNVKSQAALTNNLDKEVQMLKHDYTRDYSRFEKTLDKIGETLKDLTIEVSKYNGSFITKNKVWFVVAWFVTVFIATGYHHDLFDFIGK
jgi:hypothetical protein